MDGGTELPSASGAADVPEELGHWFSDRKLFWLPVLPMVALDLWSKSVVFLALRKQYGFFNERAVQEIFEWGWLNLEFVNWHNHGTVWGLGQDLHSVLRIVRVLAIGLIVWFAIKTPPRHRVMLTSLGLILAGAMGNLYDNFFYVLPDMPEHNYAVRDFVHCTGTWFGWSWDFPAFNVADSCITVGAALLFISLWRGDGPAKAPTRIDD